MLISCLVGETLMSVSSSLPSLAGQIPQRKPFQSPALRVEAWHSGEGGVKVLASYIHELISSPLLFQHGIHPGIPNLEILCLPCPGTNLSFLLVWGTCTDLGRVPGIQILNFQYLLSPMPETLEGFKVKNGFLAFASLGLGFSFSGWAKSTYSLLSSLQTSASIASSPILSIFWVSDFSKIPL